jgi:septum formation protein
MSTDKSLIPLEDPPSYTPPTTTTTTANGPSITSPPRRQLRPPPPLDLPFITALRSKRVILASASPRRKHLISQLGLPNIEIIPSKFEENLPKTLSPFEYVLATATQKALAVYKTEINNSTLGEPALIIAADTVVVSSLGEILEKPRNEQHHITMLKTLRDTGTHKVYTALALISPLASARDPGYALETATEETVVHFDKEATDELLWSYVRTREGVDKAGGYGIQGLGGVLVRGIEGSWDNVVGLPMRVLLRGIERIGRKADDADVLGEDEDLLEDEEEE